MRFLTILAPNAVKVIRFPRAADLRCTCTAPHSREKDQPRRSYASHAGHQNDHRSRLSRLWAPTGGIAVSADEDAHSKLIRGGFLRQAHSGLFHMLPLGLRVQEKVERLIDRHMSSLGASKLDLSSISSAELWRKSGRLAKINSELLQFWDRKGTEYLLSPTHEEEITSLIANSVKSYKELPIRLYQISRKYRDELRPRHGLLRSREFVMKDLYTFDCDTKLALETYEQVRTAYTAIFDELKIPYLVADADSGDMGGDLSHEYHFPTPQGEDHVVSCGSCDYVANEELAQASISDPHPVAGLQWRFVDCDVPNSMLPTTARLGASTMAFSVWRGVSRDRSTLVNVWHTLIPRSPTGSSIRAVLPEINAHAVKAVVPDLDSGVEHAATVWSASFQKSNGQAPKGSSSAVPFNIVNILDYRLPPQVVEMIKSKDPSLPFCPPSLVTMEAGDLSSSILGPFSSMGPLDLLRIRDGDNCPKCSEGRLHVQKAVELGHTFFLGTRYSEPLGAKIALHNNSSNEGLEASSVDASQQQIPELLSTKKVPIQMGCHGIGVSRMIGAVADSLNDQKGLNWPRVIAPYEVIVVPTKGCEPDTIAVYDILVSNTMEGKDANLTTPDVVLDDRDHPFPWKMNDADLIGYPIIIVVGKAWKKERSCQVQCRRLDIKEDVPFDSLPKFVDSLLVRL